jgi:hypothetical protein
MSFGDSITTTNSEPWEASQPYIKQGFGEAANLYNNFTPQFYQGQTQAGFSPDQLTAQQGTRNFAVEGAPNVMNPALGAFQYGTSDQVLDVANNPYVTGMAQAAADRAYSGLTPQLAGIRSGAVQSGGYGGSRQGIAEGVAMAGAADAATQAAAGIYGNAYSQGLGHQLGTLGQAGSLMNTGFRPYQQLQASGAQQQAREQALIGDAQAQHQFEQNLPYNQLQQFQAGITGLSPLIGNAGITTTTQPGPNLMQGIGSAAQIYSNLGAPGWDSIWGGE